MRISAIGVWRLVLVVVAVGVTNNDIVATLRIGELLSREGCLCAGDVAAPGQDDVGALGDCRTADVQVRALVL